MAEQPRLLRKGTVPEFQPPEPHIGFMEIMVQPEKLAGEQAQLPGGAPVVVGKAGHFASGLPGDRGVDPLRPVADGEQPAEIQGDHQVGDSPPIAEQARKPRLGLRPGIRRGMKTDPPQVPGHRPERGRPVEDRGDGEQLVRHLAGKRTVPPIFPDGSRLQERQGGARVDRLRVRPEQRPEARLLRGFLRRHPPGGTKQVLFPELLQDVLQNAGGLHRVLRHRPSASSTI